MSLYEINNTSKPNFILLDEIMGKLIDNSVYEFKDLLIYLKEKIDKILIIEHVHNIDAEHIITSIKDDTGVSKIIV